MSETMVERVARAMLARRAGESGYYDRLKAGADAFCREELEDIHADARAAIEALRVPSEAMIEEGRATNQRYDHGQYFRKDVATATYVDMIDRALKD